jgi:hypothetical protein
MALGALLGTVLVAAPAKADVPMVPVFTEVFVENGTPMDPSLALALEQAEYRAEQHPAELAPPYVSSAGTVTAPTIATADSTKTAYAAGALSVNPESVVDDGSDAEPAVGENPDKGALETTTSSAAKAEAPIVIPRFYYPATPKVKYSLTDLLAVQEEILTADIADGHLMYSAEVDAPNNRVVVAAESPTDTLRAALAARYGTDKVAVMQTPGSGIPESQARHNDTSPYFGGAKTHTGGCTTGFAWTHEGKRYLITAGHCTSLNSSFWMPVDSSQIGTVVKDNWNNSKGSVKLSGQSYYAGDLSLIKLELGNSSSPGIYTGGPRSDTNRPVAAVASRAPRYKDKYCTGGAKVGVICNWNVVQVGVTVEYSGGTIARNVVRGSKTGACTQKGDSGGPVYTVRNDGRVVAKGIHSGGGGGGSDHWGGALDPCREFFTDIRLAEKALPGIIRKV